MGTTAVARGYSPQRRAISHSKLPVELGINPNFYSEYFPIHVWLSSIDEHMLTNAQFAKIFADRFGEPSRAVEQTVRLLSAAGFMQAGAIGRKKTPYVRPIDAAHFLLGYLLTDQTTNVVNTVRAVAELPHTKVRMFEREISPSSIKTGGKRIEYVPMTVDRGLRQPLATSLAYLLAEIQGPNTKLYEEEINWFEFRVETKNLFLLLQFEVRPNIYKYKFKRNSNDQVLLPLIIYDYEPTRRSGKSPSGDFMRDYRVFGA